jgi:hypothetical protein
LAALAWGITSLVTKGHRVSADAEELGLDLPEMGSLAYPDATEISSAVVLSTAKPAATKKAA